MTAFESLVQTDADFWGGLEPDVFVAPIGEAWSPSDNVRHLAKSTKAVANALKLPRIVPTLLYGRSSARSRSYAEVVFAYRAVLAGGATAGRFAPSGQPAFTDASVFQKDVVARWSATVMKLARVVEGDRVRPLQILDQAGEGQRGMNLGGGDEAHGGSPLDRR